jgi:glucose/arabinose dehydrogenase
VRSDSGYIFVSTRTQGKIYAIKDTNGDFKADEIKLLAENLNMPNGIALKDGNLYVAEVNRILRFDDI